MFDEKRFLVLDAFATLQQVLLRRGRHCLRLTCVKVRRGM